MKTKTDWLEYLGFYLEKQDDVWMVIDQIGESRTATMPERVLWDALIEALSEVQALSAAPGVGNSGFDHQTAADFLNGKTISDEAVRKFVAASRRVHDEKTALSAMLLSVRGELASREAEIALLKKALLEAEAAPQQEPVATLHCNDIGYVWARATEVGKLMRFEQPLNLYTAPQPAPAPLSDDVVRDAARYRFLAGHCRSTSEHWGGRWSIVVDGPAPKSHDGEDDFDEAVDAALAAQGGKDA